MTTGNSIAAATRSRRSADWRTAQQTGCRRSGPALRHLHQTRGYNPGEPQLVLASVALLMRAALGWVTGYFLSVCVPRRLLIPVMVVALVALEVNQQPHAGLPTQPWLGA
jgi:hypothetical protein